MCAGPVPSRAPQTTEGVDIGVNQPITLVPRAWVVAGLVILPALPCPHHQGALSYIALGRTPVTVMSRGGVNSPALVTSESDFPAEQALLYCLGVEQG